MLDNARGFLPAPLARDERNALDHHLHMVAVCAELALKAALLAAGSSDYSNRVFIVDFAPHDRWFVRAIRRLPIASRGVYLMSCRAQLGYRTIARLTFMPVRRVKAHIAGSLLALRHDHIAAGEPSCER